MNMMLNKDEQVSALLDGQLQGADFARAVEQVAGDSAARATWQTYHLVGEVLRTGAQGAAAGDPEFVLRLRARLAQEPRGRLESATDLVGAHAGSVRATGHFDRNQEAANESSFRWKLVAGLASLAAVVAVGWNAVGGAGDKPAQAELAQAAPAAVVAEAGTTRQVMIRDPRLDELLAAHRQTGGTTALQMPAGFLRNATFEAPAR